MCILRHHVLSKLKAARVVFSNPESYIHTCQNGCWHGVRVKRKPESIYVRSVMNFEDFEEGGRWTIQTIATIDVGVVPCEPSIC